MKSTDITWLAGLLEGEGCFRLQNNGVTPSLVLRMTDYDVVLRAKMLLNGKNNIQNQFPEGNRKVIHICTIVGKKAVEWMMTLYPLMGKRRKGKIREILDVWKKNYVKSAFCKRGHERTQANTYNFIDSNGYMVRQCRVCRSLR